jgi:alkaline phosphatase
MNQGKHIERLLIALIVIGLDSFSVKAQYSTLNAHSHNDYKNVIPFWLAYYNHFGSIEADIWAVGDDLLVAHDRADIKASNSLDNLYIDPIVKLFRYNGGRAWHDYPSSFQLIIELKSETEPTLSMLVGKLKKYPDVFDPQANKNAVRVVITGNVPKPQDFGKYPDFIFFDGDLFEKYTTEQIKRVALISNDLGLFTSWNGSGEIPAADALKMKHLIDSVHFSGEKIRFWGAPDNITAWKTLMTLGVDYVNTDHINDLAEFLNSSDKH